MDFRGCDQEARVSAPFAEIICQQAESEVNALETMPIERNSHY